MRLGRLNVNDSDNHRPALSALFEAAVAASAAATIEGELSVREFRRRLSSFFPPLFSPCTHPCVGVRLAAPD